MRSRSKRSAAAGEGAALSQQVLPATLTIQIDFIGPVDHGGKSQGGQNAGVGLLALLALLIRSEHPRAVTGGSLPLASADCPAIPAAIPHTIGTDAGVRHAGQGGTVRDPDRRRGGGGWLPPRQVRAQEQVQGGNLPPAQGRGPLRRAAGRGVAQTAAQTAGQEPDGRGEDVRPRPGPQRRGLTKSVAQAKKPVPPTNCSPPPISHQPTAPVRTPCTSGLPVLRVPTIRPDLPPVLIPSITPSSPSAPSR